MSKSVTSTPAYIPSAVLVGPLMMAPAIAGNARKFKAPYFVNGTWYVRSRIVAEKTRIVPAQALAQR